MKGIVNTNNASINIIFEYGTDTNYGITVVADQSPVTGSTNIIVSAIISVLPNTTYHYRVVATDTCGNTYGEDMTFTVELEEPTSYEVSSTNNLPEQSEEPGEPNNGKNNAPGQNKEPGEAAGSKDNAPGQNKEPGENAGGKDNAPGQNKEPGGTAGGKGNAPGQNKNN